MKSIFSFIFLCSIFTATVLSQTRNSQNHIRGLLQQSVFNTGELGRAFDRGDAGMADGYSSMEWPPISQMTLNNYTYKGQHNSLGGGLYISGFKNGVNKTITCGAVTTAGNGQSVTVAGVYSNPGSITRTENYPVLANGQINAAYNPNEAEEVIASKWTTIGLKFEVTLTSRAWSFPGYDSFIIYEYDIVNIDTVDYTDGFVGWGYGFTPSMFGYERVYNRWAEGDMRSKDMYARYDLKRWMSYNHYRNGNPESDQTFFNLWSQQGERGGLNSPQAVGILPLHFDYDHLSVKGQTNYPRTADSNYVWDANNKLKQPYTNRYENANIDIAKIQSWMDIASRKTSPFNGATDSTAFVTKFSTTSSWAYWKGRSKPSWTLGWKQPVARGYVFGPYRMPKGEHLHFATAEVVGYGPGIASDSVYSDLGGGTGNEASLGFHPVPSLYRELSYSDIGGSIPLIGSNYLQTHGLPWYVTPGVVSIRDVADRAIQLYTGNPLIKWDSLQFDPGTTPATGVYNTIQIPVPAPALKVQSSPDLKNKIIWNSEVENFSAVQSAGRLKAGVSHYKVLRAAQALGPWLIIDSVGKKDPRYFNLSTSEYLLHDPNSKLGETYFYSVVAVDSLGGTSAMTNRRPHTTSKGSESSLKHVYVAPNPLIVTSTFGGSASSSGVEINDKIQFFGLTEKATIRIFSYSGQLIQTIEHDDVNSNGVEWFQVTRNNQLLASGVYFYTVDDPIGRTRATGKFVIIH